MTTYVGLKNAFVRVGIGTLDAFEMWVINNPNYILLNYSMSYNVDGAYREVVWTYTTPQ